MALLDLNGLKLFLRLQGKRSVVKKIILKLIPPFAWKPRNVGDISNVLKMSFSESDMGALDEFGALEQAHYFQLFGGTLIIKYTQLSPKKI